MNGNLKPRLVKLRKTRMLWKTPNKVVVNPYPKSIGTRSKVAEPTMRIQTYSFLLPIDTVQLETIIVNGVVVWDYDGKPVRTDVLGGGGRFMLQMNYFYGLLVQQCLQIRDMPVYGMADPEIDVIVSTFIPGSDKTTKYAKAKNNRSSAKTKKGI